MPNLFSKCEDCSNNPTEKDIEICKILSIFLPFEICEKIIRFTYLYTKCFKCHRIICIKHTYKQCDPIPNFGTIDVNCCLDCKKKC
jgi:hypothetical protein